MIEAGWFEHTSVLAPCAVAVSRQDDSTGAFDRQAQASEVDASLSARGVPACHRKFLWRIFATTVAHSDRKVARIPVEMDYLWPRKTFSAFDLFSHQERQILRALFSRMYHLSTAVKQLFQHFLVCHLQCTTSSLFTASAIECQKKPNNYYLAKWHTCNWPSN